MSNFGRDILEGVKIATVCFDIVDTVDSSSLERKEWR